MSRFPHTDTGVGSRAQGLVIVASTHRNAKMRSGGAIDGCITCFLVPRAPEIEKQI